MKKFVLKIANLFLGVLNAKIIRSDLDDFSMQAIVQRIVDHDIPVNSVVDIGASNGKWSMDAMKILPGAAFLAIEPLKEREDALQALKQSNSKFDYVLCVAGGTDGGDVTLNVSDDLDGSTVNAMGGEQRKVSARTLDSVASEKKLKAPYLLKFDTHGYEIPILEGASDTLDRTNVIIMEVYNFEITDNALRFHEMCLHMEGLGFRCYDISGPMLRPYDQSFWQMDLVFCRSDSKIFSYSQYK